MSHSSARQAWRFPAKKIMADTGTASYLSSAELVVSNAASSVLAVLPDLLLEPGASVKLEADEVAKLIGLGLFSAAEEAWIARSLDVARCSFESPCRALRVEHPASCEHFALAGKILGFGEVWRAVAGLPGNERLSRVSCVDELIGLGRRWGVDLALEAYLEGVPIEHIAS